MQLAVLKGEIARRRRRRFNREARGAEDAGMGWVLWLLLFASMGVLIVRYLQSAFRLVREVERRDPQFWRERLGRVRVIREVRRRGLSVQLRWYLSPTLPFLRWLLAARCEDVTAETERLRLRTRRLLFAGTGVFVLLIPVQLALMASG